MSLLSREIMVRGVLIAGALALGGCVRSEDAVDEDAQAGTGSTTPLAPLSATIAPLSGEATGMTTQINLTPPSVDGGDGSYQLSNDAPAGGFPLGTTSVTWVISDASGNNISVTQPITITDSTPPTIVPPPQLQASTSGGPVMMTLTPPDVSDVVDPEPVLNNDAPAQGFPLGMTRITWTASDFSGNSASTTQMVVITENTGGPLTITAPANVAVEATAVATPVSLGMATASGGDGNLTVTNDAPVGGFPLGSRTVTWTATDSNNATATATQEVLVTDTTAPQLTPPADVEQTQTGNPTPVDLGTPVASDLVDPAPTVTNDAPPTGFPVGATTVTWTAQDQSGNTATASQTITINAAASCSSLAADFANTVFPVLDQPENCGNCHTPNNVVGTGNGFNLLANDQTAFDLFRTIAEIQLGGESSMTVKALGGGNHGGGNRFAAQGENDPDFIVIRDFVQEVTTCLDSSPVTVSALSLGTDYEQVYKVTMGLAVRAPSTAEVASIQSAPDAPAKEAALRAVASQVMDEDAFYERITEIYNDVLLAEARANSSGAVRNVWGMSEYTNREYFETFPTTGGVRNTLRRAANYGMARAPLELVQYVLENDRPFTEILTADYMMVNPYSAVLFNVDAGDPDFPFSSDNLMENHDRDDFRPVSNIQQGEQGNRAVPIAGVLSTLSWLEKHRSTNTNVNRHRAANVFLDFLGVNIEALAPRDGLDLTNVVGDVPTYEDPQCTVCHNIMDPVAGLFKNRNNRGGYAGDVTWQHERTTNGVPRMLPPGYAMNAEAQLPATEEAAALPWLAQSIAADPRFAQTTVRLIFGKLTGVEPSAPATVGFINDLAADFAAGGFDFKAMVQDLVTSDYFLAQNLASGENPAEFLDFGKGRLLTPEELHRKIENLIGNGYQWQGPNSNGELTGAFKLLYGGINALDVEQRTTEPNALIDGIQKRIAQQVACERVALELNGAAGNLFPSVTVTDTPATAEAAIRDNIAHLHRYLLGEDQLPTSTEVTATYGLFQAVRNAGETAIAADCRGGGAATDDNGTILPWMAVVTYLLSDYDFLYD